MHTIFSNGKFHLGILLIILLFSFQQISFSQFADSPLDPTTKTKFEDPMPVVKDLGLRYDVTGLTDKITVKMAGQVNTLVSRWVVILILQGCGDTNSRVCPQPIPAQL
jgi:hypothetical protein